MIKRLCIIAAVCLMAFTVAAAQDSKQDSANKMKVVKEFTLTAELDGVLLNFVVLNNKTVDALFSGSGKYAIRARANQSTMFYVQGVPDKSIRLYTQFRVEQSGMTIPGKSVNIKNFKDDRVEKGEMIEGLIELSKKINLAVPFKIINANNMTAEFRLSPEALKLLEN